ncbi:MAG: MFS transporter, partial [Acidimicrobiales bacterium]
MSDGADRAVGADRAITVGGLWGAGVRRLTTGLVLTVTLVAFESLSVATVLPVVSRQLGDLRLYGWVFSAFFLASLIGIVVAGGLADRTGLALPLTAGLAFFAAGLVIGGLAPDMPTLVAGRAVQGLGAGAVPAVAYAAIGRAYPGHLRPRMFAVLSTAWVVPGLIGPALAAVIANAASWRWVFLGIVPLVALSGLLTGPAMSRVGPPSAPEGAAQGLPSALWVTAGAAAFLAGLSVTSPLPAALLVCAGLGAAAPALRKLTPEGTLRGRAGLPAAVGARGVLTFAFFAADAYVPLSLTSVRHTSTTFAGLTLTASTIAWTAGSWWQAHRLAGAGPRRLVSTGMAVVAAGVIGMATLLVHQVPLAFAPIWWAVAGFGIGMAYSPLSVTTLDAAPPGQEGRASAGLQLADVLGVALGTGIA